MTEPDLKDWIGRTQDDEDTVHDTPVRALAATLDRDDIDARAGAPLPPLWHWLYFLPIVPMSGIGPDGHPKRGGFLPPIELERRMWASGRLTFRDHVQIGETIHKRATILDVSEKEGKSGRMVFVRVGHVVSTARGVAIEEEQDIVYLAMPKVFTPPPPTLLPAPLAFTEPVGISPVMLFRFSALTFNGHRIHYDEPYATSVEKYPGLVVHGPLQAVLLMEAGRRHTPGRTPARYTFRAMRPLFGFDRVSVSGRAGDGGTTDLYTADGESRIGMHASIAWADGGA